MSKNLLFYIVMLFLTACNTKNDLDKTIPIYYDYQKGFSLDTLSTGISPASFSHTIDSIEKIVVDLTSYNDVFLSKEFINLYVNPEMYINNVIIYIADKTKTKQQRMIALLAMQRKGITNNLNFLYASNYLYRQGLIDESMILQILFPIDINNVDIIKYYESEQIKTVLRDINQNTRSPENLKQTVNDILSGKTYKEQKKFLAGQYNMKI